MEQKLVRVPFEVGLAKRIQNGECEGKIVTRDGRSVRVICWDRQYKRPIISLIVWDDIEEIRSAFINGKIDENREDFYDLFLEIPEYLTFKDGDILYAESMFGSDFIFVKKDDTHKTSKYVSLMNKIDLLFENRHCCEDSNIKILRKATEGEKQTLINALRVSKHECAKEYLKRFFGIDYTLIIKQEYEFKPFDRVLVRDSEMSEWVANIFSHEDVRETYSYRCVDDWYKFCIPYNDQTAHLLGTTEDYKEE